MRYMVEIQETLSMTVDVEAESKEEAEEIVKTQWNNSEYVLDSGNFVSVMFTTEMD